LRTPLVVSLSLCVTLTGCLSTVSVKRDPLDPTQLKRQGQKTEVPGIPFYVKTAECKQETTWIEPVFRLTLKRTSAQKFKDENAAKKEAESTKQPEKLKLESTVTSSTRVLSWSDYQKEQVSQLQGLLGNAGAKPEESQVDTAWTSVTMLRQYSPFRVDEDALIASKNVIQVANTAGPEVMVDYSRTYYYNTPRPLAGTSKANAKLAADGTLTEGASEVDSQTFSTIMSPVNTVVSAAAKGASAGAAVPGYTADPFATKEEVTYELTVQQEIYKHTHTAFAPFELPCKTVEGGVKSNYALKIEMPGAASSAKDDAKPDKAAKPAKASKAGKSAASDDEEE
jgi:hypothetical protein